VTSSREKTARPAAAGERSVEERIAGKEARLHILAGTVCNNNCIFCMEEDRDARKRANSATTDEVVRWLLEQHRPCDEVCFTSGEPTTNERLVDWIRLASAAGVGRISMMTNGRALSYESYTRRLLAAGMNRFYVSIHGHERKLHESLTRTPDSFEQTRQGIENIARLRGRGVDLHSSTVVTKRNLAHLGDIYRFLRSLGVDQVVFNAMQPNGRANTHFERLFPRYTEIARAVEDVIAEQSRAEPRVMAFLVDMPLCTTTRLPDFNRGYVEAYAHVEPPTPGGLITGARLSERRAGPDGDLVRIERADLDDARREKRHECSSCRHCDHCEGVWSNYLRRFGWEELVPVE